MSDIGHEHEPARPVLDSAVHEAPTPTLTVETSPTEAIHRSMRSAGPTAVSAGRARRAATVTHRTPTSVASRERIQRAPARTPHGRPEPVAAAGRIQPMATQVLVQRSLRGKIASAGRGIRSAAEATGRAIGHAASTVKSGLEGVAEKIHRSDFNDLNATQYLVSAGGLIEAINRDTDADGNVVYYRTGSVSRGEGDRPTITPYDPVRPMPPGWLPTVTHINGMMVKPNSGLGSAIRLQQELERAGADGALLAADVPQVLYTYSAHRGFVTDLAECIWGKLYQDDDATDRQTQIMLDAVANQHRTTVSAHSRGTIKTDNAVRNAHAEISRGHLDAGLTDPRVAADARDAARAAADTGLGLSPAMLEHVYVRLFAQERADRVATEEMDRYVQLIYAGNAVQFPSAAVNLNLVVAGSDPVTIAVGKYFRRAKGSKTKMTDVEGGHGFNSNYAATVADLVIADLKAQTPP